MTHSSAPTGWVPTQHEVDEFFQKQAAAFAKIAPLVPVCPDWCIEPHREDAVTAVDCGKDGVDQITRFHRRTLVHVPHTQPDVGVASDDIDVAVEAMEHVNADGVVTRHPAAVVLANADGVDLSSDTATRLVAALLAACDYLQGLS